MTEKEALEALVFSAEPGEASAMARNVLADWYDERNEPRYANAWRWLANYEPALFDRTYWWHSEGYMFIPRYLRSYLSDTLFILLPINYNYLKPLPGDHINYRTRPEALLAAIGAYLKGNP